MDNVLIGLFSGLIGSLLGSVIVWKAESNNRRQQIFLEWYKIMADHNIELLQIDNEKNSKNNKLRQKVNCYQNLNLLYLAWTSKGLICNGPLLKKLNIKNWIDKVIINKSQQNKAISDIYRNILINGDMYPIQFIKWLEEKFGVSAKNLLDQKISK